MAVNRLLDKRVLHIVPTINPDARDHFFHSPNTASSPRTGLSPRDNDMDGRIDEDGLDDLDGDGHITQMRRRNTNGLDAEAKWRLSYDPQCSMAPARLSAASDSQLGHG